MSRIALALLCALALCGVGASGADFTATSHSPTTITAAADFNTVAVTLDAVGSPLSGTVGLTATATSERGIASVTFQRAPAGTTAWVDICTDTTSAYTCSWNTTGVADGSYDVRALATDNAGYTRADVRSARLVDNVPLTVSLTDPGAMSGNENLTATTANATGGLLELTIQHRAPGDTSWTTVCTGTTSPRTCPLNTTVLPEGGRELRAIARDGAGRNVQSATLTRTIDNTAPQMTPNTPATGHGTVTMTVTATDTGSGIAYVKWEALYQGTWYEFCRDTAAPYVCSGDSAWVPDGTYDVRVTTVDNAGVPSTAATSQVTIDNTRPLGTSVTTGDGGGGPGLLAAGDWVTLTWSEPIAPASVLAGWDGSSQAILVRVNALDQMDFLTTGGARLNLVHGVADLKLGADFVTGDAEFDATMTRSGSSITITLGATRSGTLATALAGTMTWVPSGSVTDIVGNLGRTDTVTEGGAADVDF